MGTTILDFLNDPVVKTVMLFAGQMITRLHPKIRTEAGTIWSGIYSVVTAFFGNLWGAPGPVAASYGESAFSFAAATAAAAIPWWQSLLLNGILPWLISLGGVRASAHSARLYTGQTTVSVPVETNIKPFQLLLSPTQVENIEGATVKAVAAAEKSVAAHEKVAEKADAAVEKAAEKAHKK